MKKALLVRGGWDGHEPFPVSEILAGVLRDASFEVILSDTLDSFKDADLMGSLDLAVPIWTMGQIDADQVGGLLAAVTGGCGIAGIHGGMGDAFRDQTEYQYMCGGQWVAHPGGIVTYGVHLVDPWNPLTAGIEDFEMTSEQYFMHVDPGNVVLATTTFGHTVMPVAWIKSYGQGRVYYSSLGHVAADLSVPGALELIKRGMIWAAGGKG